MIVAALLLFCDIVHLKNGGRLEGKVIEETETKVRLQQAKGVVVEFDRAKVDRVEYCLWFPPPPGKTAAFGEVVLDPAKFLRFYVPEGWRPGKPQGKALASVFRYSSDGTTLNRYDVYLQADPEGVKGAAKKFRQAYEKAVPAAVVTQEPLAIGGVDAVRLDVEIDKGEERKDGAFWLFVGGPDSRVLMANFTEDHSDFAVLGEAVFDAAQTLRAVPETKMTDDERKAFDEAARKGYDAFLAGDNDKAIAALREAVKLGESFAPAWGLLARAQARKGDGDGARTSFEKALALDASDFILETHYASLLTDQGKAEAASKRLAALVDKYPRYAAAVAELGRAMKKQSKYGDAGAAYDYLKLLLPRSADARYWRGQVCEAEGRFEKARLEYMDALRKDPDHAAAQDALDKIRNKPDK